MTRRGKQSQAEAKAPTIRCAIYTRKSSEEGLKQEFNSLDAQREAAEAYIASQHHEGWVALPERYDDGGFTGGNMDRPALVRLMADIDAGKVDCVIVYKVDRLSRSLLDFSRIMEQFDKHEVSFVSVTQHFNTTHSMGRLTLNILLSFAQFEREIIGERIRDKIAAQRRRGKWAGGIPILGYDVDRKENGSRLVVNHMEAPRVRAIFALYLEKGSLLPTVEELVQRGWLTKQWRTRAGADRGGKPFDRGSLYTLLTNPTYVGKVKHKQDVYDGEHEALVERDVFDRVQALLQRNGRNGGYDMRNKHGALLRGLLRCKACSRTMVHTFTSKGSRRYRYYTCTHAIKSGRKRCPSGSLPAGEIEEAVVDQVHEMLSDPEWTAATLATAERELDQKRHRLVAEQQGVERAVHQHTRQIEELVTQHAEADENVRRVADLNDQIRQAETRLRQIADELAEHDARKVSHSDVAEALEDFERTWDTLSQRERVRVIQLLVARVDYDVTDSTIEVAFQADGIAALAAEPSMEAV
ncbi:MAG: recombinase family protein [Phycisphaeraceae bacterium]